MPGLAAPAALGAPGTVAARLGLCGHAAAFTFDPDKHHHDAQGRWATGDASGTPAGAAPPRTAAASTAEMVTSGLCESAHLDGLRPDEAAAVLGALRSSLRVAGHQLYLRSIQLLDKTPDGDQGGLSYSNGVVSMSRGFVAQARTNDRAAVREGLRGTGGERNFCWQDGTTPAEAIALAVAHEVGHHVDTALFLDVFKGVRDTRDAGLKLDESAMVQVSGYASTHAVELFAEVHAFASIGRWSKLPPSVQAFYQHALATADPEPIFVKTAAGAALPAAAVGPPSPVTIADLRKTNNGIGSVHDGAHNFYDKVLVRLHNQGTYQPLLNFAKAHPDEFIKLQRAMRFSMWRDLQPPEPFTQWEKTGTVTLYRGYAQGGTADGPSWSTRKDIADGFAKYGSRTGWRIGCAPNPTAVVAEKRVKVSDIFAYSNAQDESEALIGFANEHHDERGRFAPTDGTAAPAAATPPPAGAADGDPHAALSYKDFRPGETRPEVLHVPHAVRQAAAAWERSLTPQERAAVVTYTGSMFKTLNRDLRHSPDDLNYLDDEQRSVHVALTTALAKAPPLQQPVNVWRGLRLRQPRERAAFLDAMRTAAASGEAVAMHGWQSTSLDPAAAQDVARDEYEGVVLEIKARTGAFVGGLSKIAEEAEFLQPHGMRYRVVAVHDKVRFREANSLDTNSYPVVRLEEMPARPAAFAWDPAAHPKDDHGRFATNAGAGLGHPDADRITPAEADHLLAQAEAACAEAWAASDRDAGAAPDLDEYAARLGDAAGYEAWERARSKRDAKHTKWAPVIARLDDARYQAEALAKAAKDPLPLRRAFASFQPIYHASYQGSGRRCYLTELGRLVDASDRTLTGRAGHAVDSFVGLSHSTIDAGAVTGGIMCAGPLEAIAADPPATPEDAEARVDLERHVAPVRALLRRQFGDTLPLYRFQSAIRGDEAPRVVLSWTANPRFAQWHGQGMDGKVLERQVPVADVVWVTNRAGQAEFVVRTQPAATAPPAAFAFDPAKHPKDAHGRWAGGGGAAVAEPPAAAAPAKPDIDQAEVTEDRGARELLTSWDFYDDESVHWPQQIYINQGTYDPDPDDPDSEPLDVWRWESHQEGAGALASGAWTANRQEAEAGGYAHASENNQAEPEPEPEPEPELEPEEEDEDEPEEEDANDQRFDQARRLFGDAGDDFITGVLGVPDDARVAAKSAVRKWESHYSDDADLDAVGVEVKITHPKIEECRRFLGVDEHGNRFIKNDVLTIKPEFRGGLGTQIFAAEVDNAVREGFAYIQTHAAGDVHNEMNGYYTWPRLGYDETLDSLAGYNPTRAGTIRERFPHAASILDVLATPAVALPDAEAHLVRAVCADKDKERGLPVKERTTITGRDWWLVHGDDLRDARFDLAEGSRSRQALDAYRKERSARRGR